MMVWFWQEPDSEGRKQMPWIDINIGWTTDWQIGWLIIDWFIDWLTGYLSCDAQVDIQHGVDHWRQSFDPNNIRIRCRRSRSCRLPLPLGIPQTLDPGQEWPRPYNSHRNARHRVGPEPELSVECLQVKKWMINWVIDWLIDWFSEWMS